MWFFHIIFPYSEKLLISELPFLVSAVQHSICCIFHIFPEPLYRMKIPTNSIIVVMSCQRKVDQPHCVCNWFRQPSHKPCFHCLLLHFQSLLAGSHSQTVFSAPCSCIEECKSQKIEIFLCPFEAPYRQDSGLVPATSSPNFANRVLNNSSTLTASSSYWNIIRKSSA